MGKTILKERLQKTVILDGKEYKIAKNLLTERMNPIFDLQTSEIVRLAIRSLIYLIRTGQFDKFLEEDRNENS